MTNKGLVDMSIKDDQERCRSLVCDPNGIIVAEMVYRCMICFYVSDSMPEARNHYVQKHIEEEEISNENVDQIDLDESIPKHLKKLQNNNTNKYQNGNRNSSNSLNDNNGCLDFSSNNSSKYRSSPTEPIDMSPSSDSFDNFLPHVTADGLDSSANGNPINGSKSGYVNCAVCGVTRFYSCVQRRYGQFTCVTCYRYFKSFFDKPERYSCPQLGKCQLNVRTRCRACWIKVCMDLFQVDQEKQQLMNTFAPVKHSSGLGGLASLSSLNNNSEEDDEHVDADALELESSSPIDDKMDHSDDNNNSINNNLNGFGQMNQSKEALSMMFALNNNGTDLPALLRKNNLDGFSLLTHASNFVNSNAGGLFGSLNLSENQNVANGLGDDDNPLSFFTPKRGQLNSKALNSNSLNGLNLTTSNLNGGNAEKLKNGSQDGKDSNNNKLSANKTKGSAGKKVWSCGKCATCVSEDCGKCIYCLDRPKFGGPFVKKQRCIKRRCLMKIKTKVDKKSLSSSSGNLDASNGGTSGLVPISIASSMAGSNSNTSTFVF